MELTNSLKTTSGVSLPLEKLPRTGVRQPGSALTHLLGVFFALTAAAPLLKKAGAATNRAALPSCIIYLLSVLALYSASTLYHTFGSNAKSFLRLKRLDHCMVYALIAGTYTPLCLLGTASRVGVPLLVVLVTFCILGMIFCIFFPRCPEWVTAVLYVLPGWCCVVALPSLCVCCPTVSLVLLFVGGIIYTVGALLYALKLPIYSRRHPYFGLHEVFHCFCLGGTFCHFLMIFFLL